MKRWSVLLVALGALALAPSAALAEFGFESFDVTFTNADSSPATQAGAHPALQTTSFTMKTKNDPQLGVSPDGSLKTQIFTQVVGLAGNPTVVDDCTTAQFYAKECPSGSVVGTAEVLTLLLEDPVLTRVFSMVPSPGAAARLGFFVDTVPVAVELKVSPDPPFNIIATGPPVPQAEPLVAVTVDVWGVPADPSHDPQRCAEDNALVTCAPTTPLQPFLTLPRACTGPLETTYAINSWQDPTTWVRGSDEIPGMEGCATLTFTPQVEAGPTNKQAASPTGFKQTITVSDPGLLDPDGRAQSDLKQAVVTLPEGLVVNPASAHGLGACSPAQLQQETADSDPGEGCPLASKVATIAVETPLLEEKLSGSLFLATPHDNPFGTLLAGYLVIRQPERGIVLRIPGKIEADPVTGQLKASFDQNPQHPFSHLEVVFPDGPRASLATPRTCGPLAITTVLDSWAGHSLTQSSPFEITGCAPPQFAPTLEAGLTDTQAGGSSPFVLRLQRSDIDNELKTVKTSMPPGLLAKLAGVPRCTDAEAAAGACPEASRVGRVEAGAGVGPAPFYITAGRAYLTDGYQGAPFGLLVSVPAVAGPFDLGVVNVRAALHVDPVTAQVTAVADAAPRILEGIPLAVRDVRVIVDRAGFMRAPTSCDEMAVGGAIGSWADDTATPSSRFQVGGCAGLPFKPKLRIRLTGASQTRDGGHPGVTAVATQRPGEAGIKQVKVALPLSLALDPGNAAALCEYEDGLRLNCPASSIIGHAEAVTPLLNEPLTGPVYFVKNVRISPRTGRPIRTLPTLLVTLTGENGLKINLRASSDVDKRARLVSSFSNLPDAPVSSFKLRLKGGRDGILVVTHRTNVCRGRHVAVAQTDGHNGKRHDPRIRLATPCVKAGKPRLRRGKLRLPVRVPRAGTLSAGGGKSGLTKTTRRLAKPGKTTLTLKPTRKARRTIARRGRMRLRVPIRFTPRGTKQAQRTTSPPITLRR